MSGFVERDASMTDDLTLDELTRIEDMPEWIVFQRSIESQKLVLKELAQVPAIDADRAIILVAEDLPTTDGKDLCAIEASSVKGRKVRLRYLASLD